MLYSIRDNFVKWFVKGQSKAGGTTSRVSI